VRLRSQLKRMAVLVSLAAASLSASSALALAHYSHAAWLMVVVMTSAAIFVGSVRTGIAHEHDALVRLERLLNPNDVEREIQGEVKVRGFQSVWFTFIETSSDNEGKARYSVFRDEVSPELWRSLTVAIRHGATTVERSS
jgi:uncharacterized membrane protein YcjF (UPF0283 family)